jgi:hypothetical protein
VKRPRGRRSNSPTPSSIRSEASISGVALVTGKPKGANGFVSYFCVYDKQTKNVELGSELETENMRLLPDE